MYSDYLWIALFTIGLYNGAKIVWLIIESKIDNYLRKKRYAPRPINTFDLLESSHRFEYARNRIRILYLYLIKHRKEIKAYKKYLQEQKESKNENTK